MALQFLVQQINQSAGSLALRESIWIYPIVETTHVVSLALFVGTVLMVDLRLLGLAFRRTPISEMASRILPWTIFGFLITAATGLLLFYAIPERSFYSVWLRLKVALIVLAGLNAMVFHWRARRNKNVWDQGTTPRSLRVTGAISLAAWITAIFMGRMIAYDWFDCGKPRPAWVEIVAQCPADSEKP